MTASFFELDAQSGGRTATLTELRTIARRYALNPNLAALLPESTDRTWARLAGDARTDIWLISWPEGTQTGWHDHGEAAGAFVIASGVVIEQTWALGAVQTRRLAEGDSRAFGRTSVHNVLGPGPGRALTVHAYAPGLVETGRFELAANGPIRSATTEDASAW